MTKKINPIGIVTLLIAIAYIIIPYDMDRIGWYGYIDDFFVFMAGYLLFFGSRDIHPRLKRLLYLIAGCSFIIAMLFLTVMIILS